MANVIPFKGILYNPDKTGDFRNVVAPPYDVISKEEQHNLHERHLKNVIRLILGEKTKEDTADNNPHTRAADYFNNWLSEQTLVQDQTPAFYLTSVEFTLGEKRVTRFGLIALVGLEPFEKGIVLPHEKTFSKVKSERLELMKRAHANFSPIFSLYNDNENILNSLKNAVADKSPDMDIVDDRGERHKLWRITDKSVHDKVTGALGAKRIFIADGHHRYETALNYRKWISKNESDFDDTHPANFIMMYLCSMDDPGLVILPAHRILNGVNKTRIDGFISEVGKYFDVDSIPFDKGQTEKVLGELITTLKKNDSKNIIGCYIKDGREFFTLTLKPGASGEQFGEDLSDALRQLDVIVLTSLIFMDILGFDQGGLDNEKLITYSSKENDAIESVVSGQSDIAFILNPTKIEQVKNIAEQGEIMPRKATYFYPKAITGQVLNKLTR